MVKEFLDLFISFFKVGLFTIGGGYAMLPIIERELVDSKQMMTMDEVLECYSLAQSLPGVIASNTAVFVGYRRAGVKGAVAAVLGVIIPSILIILGIAAIFDRVKDNPYVTKAFNGMRVVVLALLINSMLKLVKKSVKGILGWIIAIVSFVVVMFTSISPVYVILLAGLIAVLVYRGQVVE